MTKTIVRVICTVGWVVLFLTPGAVSAQIFKAPGDPVVGESYHIEASGDLWFPTSNLIVSSEALGIAGDNIDLVRDLGIPSRKSFREFRLVLRPSTKHKFKLQYNPMTYTGAATIQRSFKFNGLQYSFGIPVTTAFDWKVLRIGYEYDFIHRDIWYLGFMLDARMTDARVQLESTIPALGTEFARARGPVPSLGFTGRVYPIPNVAFTTEVSFFKIPESLDQRYRARYVDYDLYGTINFVRWAGVQLGYRRLSMDYLIRKDAGNLKMGGVYMAGVLRY